MITLTANDNINCDYIKRLIYVFKFAAFNFFMLNDFNLNK